MDANDVNSKNFSGIFAENDFGNAIGFILGQRFGVTFEIGTNGRNRKAFSFGQFLGSGFGEADKAYLWMGEGSSWNASIVYSSGAIANILHCYDALGRSRVSQHHLARGIANRPKVRYRLPFRQHFHAIVHRDKTPTIQFHVHCL